MKADDSIWPVPRVHFQMLLCVRKIMNKYIEMAQDQSEFAAARAVELPVGVHSLGWVNGGEGRPAQHLSEQLKKRICLLLPQAPRGTQMELVINRSVFINNEQGQRAHDVKRGVPNKNVLSSDIGKA